MSFSISERDFLYQSLAKSGIRPDGRKHTQLRAVQASTSFLPNSNGSSRIRLVDGSEAIISVKCKVVEQEKFQDLVEIDLNLDDLRDDLVFIKQWARLLKSLVLTSLGQQDQMNQMKLTSKYSFKLFIDVLYISGNGANSRNNDSVFLQNPLSMISFGIFLALKTTKLPQLVSSANDQEIEELPTFNDDWSASVPLYLSNPPVFFVAAITGNNVILDPSIEEQEVSDCGVVVGWCEGVISPIEMVNLNQSGNNEYYGGCSPELMIKVVQMVNDIGNVVVTALNQLL